MLPILCTASAENLEQVSRDPVAVETVEGLSNGSIASINEVTFKSARIVSSAIYFVCSE
jgi:hypothetical protein